MKIYVIAANIKLKDPPFNYLNVFGLNTPIPLYVRRKNGVPYKQNTWILPLKEDLMYYFGSEHIKLQLEQSQDTLANLLQREEDSYDPLQYVDWLIINTYTTINKRLVYEPKHQKRLQGVKYKEKTRIRVYFRLIAINKWHQLKGTRTSLQKVLKKL